MRDAVRHAWVGAAATELAVPRGVDLLVGRLRRVLQQAGGLHDLAGLTEATLRHVDLAPGHLQRMFAGGVESFDRGNRRVLEVRHRQLAGAGRLSADVHGAGTALRYAATVLRAGQRKIVAQVPE